MNIGDRLAIIIPLLFWVIRASEEWVKNKEFNFGWLVLPLLLYLFQGVFLEKKCVVLKSKKLLVILLVTCGLVLVSLSELYRLALHQTPTSLNMLTFGTVLYINGFVINFLTAKSMVRMNLSLVLLFLAIPTPAAIGSSFVNLLQGGVTSISCNLLNLIGIPSENGGVLIITGEETFEVTKGCSGIFGLKASLILSLFLGLSLCQKVKLVGAFVLVAVAISYIVNLFRVFLICVISYKIPSANIDSIHDNLSGILMIINIFVIYTLSKILTTTTTDEKCYSIS